MCVCVNFVLIHNQDLKQCDAYLKNPLAENISIDLRTEI